MELDRRELLFSGAAALGVTLAGCAADPVDDADENETDNDTDGSEDADENDTDDGTESDDTGDEADNDTDTGDGNGDDGLETEDNDTDTDDGDEDVGDGDGDGDDGNETDGDDDGGDDDDEDGDDDSDGGEGDQGDTAEDSDDDTDENGDEDEGNGDGDDDGGEGSDSDDENDDDDDDDDDGEDGVEEPPVSEITITVVDPDGEPIEDAAIRGEGDPHEADIPLEFTGETDADGVHSTPIYENSYTIEVRHGNFESATVEHVHDGETEVTVELEPVVEEPPSSEITVWVVDADGNPIEGASVSGVGDSHPADIPLEFSGETDDDGILSTPIYENSYTIEVDHPDYVAETVEHVHDGETEVTVELESAVQEPPTSELTFTVTDANGNPIEGASVSGVGEMHPADIAREFEGETDADGVYVTLIYENTYTIEVDHPDYMRKTFEYEFTGDDGIDVELRMPDGESTLDVEAVHPVSGEPVSGVTVSVTPTNGNGAERVGETDGDGIATFVVDTGEYRIVAYGRELHRAHPWARVVVVDEPTTVTARAVVEPEDCTARIEVIDRETGSAFEGAEVEVSVDRPDHDLLTDSRGETRENGIAEITTWCGEWEITARGDGRRVTDTFFVDSSSPAPLVLDL